MDPQIIDQVPTPAAAGVTRRQALIRAAQGTLLTGGLPAALMACGGSSGGGSSSGSVLRIGLTNNIDSLNPFVQQETAAIVATHAMYPTLTRGEGPTYRTESDWASSYQVTDGGRKIVFMLRTDGKWSDGKPLTVKDAVFTLNTVVKFQTGATALLGQYVLNIVKATAQDDHTLVIEYKAPLTNALELLEQLPILPEHVWGKFATGNGAGLKTFQVTDGAVSGGPFALQKYASNNITLLSRNPGWYGAKPAISGFGLQSFGSQDAMLAALKSGSIDAVQLLSPTEGLSSLKSSGVTLSKIPGFLLYEISINTNPKKPHHRELLNPNVRHALSMAIDRDSIVKVVLFGEGTAGASVVPPASGVWSDKSIKPDPFDIDQANKILDSLGYHRGSNGIRMADGHPMSYVMNVANEVAGNDRLMQIVSNGWQRIGVHVTSRVLDTAAMLSAIAAPNGKYLSNDMDLWAFIPVPDPSSILEHFQTSEIGGYNDPAYSNPTYDHLYVQQSETLNASKRRALVYRMQQMIATDRPILVLCYVDALSATGTKFTRYTSTSLGPFNYLSRDQFTKIKPA